jgi:hypothetical protein
MTVWSGCAACAGGRRADRGAGRPLREPRGSAHSSQRGAVAPGGAGLQAARRGGHQPAGAGAAGGREGMRVGGGRDAVAQAAQPGALARLSHAALAAARWAAQAGVTFVDMASLPDGRFLVACTDRKVRAAQASRSRLHPLSGVRLRPAGWRAEAPQAFPHAPPAVRKDPAARRQASSCAEQPTARAAATHSCRRTQHPTSLSARPPPPAPARCSSYPRPTPRWPSPWTGP